MAPHIVPAQIEHCASIASVQANFLSSKHACCCVPLSFDVSGSGFRKRFEKHPELLAVARVALSDDGEVLGYIQLVFHGMPCDLHTPRMGECYVDSMAVLPSARGRGIGTKFLEWAFCEARARECDIISLGVIRGNPAIRLYERVGFVHKEMDIVETCFSTIFVGCCLFGPVICPSGAPHYVSCGRASMMEKQCDREREKQLGPQCTSGTSSGASCGAPDAQPHMERLSLDAEPRLDVP